MNNKNELIKTLKLNDVSELKKHSYSSYIHYDVDKEESESKRIKIVECNYIDSFFYNLNESFFKLCLSENIDVQNIINNIENYNLKNTSDDLRIKNIILKIFTEITKTNLDTNYRKILKDTLKKITNLKLNFEEDNTYYKSYNYLSSVNDNKNSNYYKHNNLTFFDGVIYKTNNLTIIKFLVENGYTPNLQKIIYDFIGSTNNKEKLKPNVLNFLLENTTFDENDYRLAKNRENSLTDRLSLINAKIISKEYLVPIYNFLHENGISLIEDISKMLHFLTNLENIKSLDTILEIYNFLKTDDLQNFLTFNQFNNIMFNKKIINHENYNNIFMKYIDLMCLAFKNNNPIKQGVNFSLVSLEKSVHKVSYVRAENNISGINKKNNTIYNLIHFFHLIENEEKKQDIFQLISNSFNNNPKVIFSILFNKTNNFEYKTNDMGQIDYGEYKESIKNLNANNLFGKDISKSISEVFFNKFPDYLNENRQIQILKEVEIAYLKDKLLVTELKHLFIHLSNNINTNNEFLFTSVLDFFMKKNPYEKTSERENFFNIKFYDNLLKDNYQLYFFKYLIENIDYILENRISDNREKMYDTVILKFLNELSNENSNINEIKSLTINNDIKLKLSELTDIYKNEFNQKKLNNCLGDDDYKLLDNINFLLNNIYNINGNKINKKNKIKL